MIKIRWTGAAGIEFVTAQGIFLIDPYLSRLGKFQVFFQDIAADTERVNKYLDNLSLKVSGIIVGHTHLDHALDIPYIAQHSICRPDCKIIGSKSLDSLFNMHGLFNRVLVCEGDKKHQIVEFGNYIRVEMIPSVHGKVIFGRIPFPGEIDPDKTLPVKAGEYRHGAVFIPKIRIENTTFMHLGSADYIESELDGHRCDILFMCVPGWRRKKGYTRRLIDIIKPEIIIPFHFDDFSRAISKTDRPPVLPFQGMENLIKKIKKNFPKIKIIVPEINAGLEKKIALF